MYKLIILIGIVLVYLYFKQEQAINIGQKCAKVFEMVKTKEEPEHSKEKRFF